MTFILVLAQLMLVFLDKALPLILRALCAQILSSVTCNLRMIFSFYSGNSKNNAKLRNQSGFMDIYRFVILSLNFVRDRNYLDVSLCVGEGGAWILRKEDWFPR